MTESGERARRIGVGAVRISPREKEYVQQVLDSNRLSYGPFSRRLETEFAEAHGCRHAVLSNSGTSSLQVAVAALREKRGWQDGDEVLCPAASFVATSNVILHNNLVPVFVDVEPDTYNLDPGRIESHLTDRTRAILVAHLYGQPAEMDPILAIARSRGLGVIEDSAETMFARYRGRSVGSLGDIGCFSTYACHILVTGVGGLSTTSDRSLAGLMRSLVNHGRDGIYFSMDDAEGKTGDDLQEVMAGRFRFVRLGHSYRITEMEAALGVGQMEAAPENLRIRRGVATALLEGLSLWESWLQLPRPREDRDHSYMMFPILLRPEAPFRREELTLHLEEAGVETRPMVTVLNQPFYRARLGEGCEDGYPVSRAIARGGFYVGCHPEMDEDSVGRVLRTFSEFLSRY